MAGDVVNIKVCSPLKLHSGLTRKYYAICHYSYNLTLSVSVESQPHIQAHLVFADTQSQNKKPKELEFCQRSK